VEQSPTGADRKLNGRTSAIASTTTCNDSQRVRCNWRGVVRALPRGVIRLLLSFPSFSWLAAAFPAQRSTRPPRPVTSTAMHCNAVRQWQRENFRASGRDLILTRMFPSGPRFLETPKGLFPAARMMDRYSARASSGRVSTAL
jgi:hypothetical protein